MGASEPAAEVEERRVSGDTREGSEYVNYDITIKDEDDWNTLVSAERVEIAEFCIEQYKEEGTSSGYTSVYVFGYNSNEDMLFNENKNFQNNSPDTDL